MFNPSPRFVERSCLYCQCVFETARYRLAHGRGKYCSRKCNAAHISSLLSVQKPCLYCQQTFKVILHTLEIGKGKFCSQPCYWAYQQESKTTEERLKDYCVIPDDPDECWVWQGPRAAFGYGKITIRHIGYSAHRLSFKTFRGPIPKGMHVCHRCDNPPCINPRHLFLGTPQDNISDMVGKGRHSFGEHQGASKLTEQQVRKIRKLRQQGMSAQKIADRFGVTRSPIYSILQGKSWKHVV